MFYVHYFYASHEVSFLRLLISFFLHQLQTAENKIFLVIENIFNSGLDGTM